MKTIRLFFVLMFQSFAGPEAVKGGSGNVSEGNPTGKFN